MQSQDEEMGVLRGRVASLEESLKWQVTQVQGKEGEITEVKITVSNLQRALAQKQEEVDEVAQQSEKAQSKQKALVAQLQGQLKESQAKVDKTEELQAALGEQ